MPDSSGRPRVARFDEVPRHSDQFLDAGLPEHARTVYNVIGTNVADPAGDASIPPEDFNLGIVEAAPGKGPALHDHETVEVLVPLSGEWEVYYDDDRDGEERIVLKPWDTVQIPPGVFRGFRNVGEEDAYMLAVTGGEDSGRVVWADDVVEKVERRDLARDEEADPTRSDRSD